MREEVVKTIGRGYFLIVIGLLWYAIQEGWLSFSKAFAVFLVFLGLYLIIKGVVVGGVKRETPTS